MNHYTQTLLMTLITITLPACQSFGSSLVYPNFTGARNVVNPESIDKRSVGPMSAYNVVNPEFTNAHNVTEELPAGYVTNGTVDYTAAIQKAVSKFDVLIFPGFPLLVNDKGIIFHDNQKVLFTPGSQLRLAPSQNASYSVIRVENAKNVKLVNPVVIGDMKSHIGKSGEWGMDIAILGADHITLINPETSNAWGDGIYVGPSAKNKIASNIAITGAQSGNNRRNGLSIVSVDQLSVTNSEFFKNVGTAPKAGIDFEPNNNNAEITGVNLQNIKTYDNHYGIEVELAALNKNGNTRKTVNININNHKDTASDYAFAVGIVGSTPKSKGVASGNIVITNPVWEDSTIQPIYTEVKTKAADGPNLIFSGTKVTRHSNIVPFNSLGSDFTQYISQ